MDNPNNYIKELNNTLLKILCELRIIKTLLSENKNKNNTPVVPTNDEVSKGWFWS
jgi:hypothetical protein